MSSAFRLYASVDSSTVAAAWTQIKSIFKRFAIGTRREAVFTLTRTWGISRRKMLLAWISTHAAAPFKSSVSFAAIYSDIEPVSEPGNVRFISRSHRGMPRVIVLMPSGFKAG